MARVQAATRPLPFALPQVAASFATAAPGDAIVASSAVATRRLRFKRNPPGLMASPTFENTRHLRLLSEGNGRSGSSVGQNLSGNIAIGVVGLCVRLRHFPRLVSDIAQVG